MRHHLAQDRIGARQFWPSVYALILGSLLVSCGGGDSTRAEASDVVVAGWRAGVSPFIAFIDLHGTSLVNAVSIRYTIAPRIGAISKPVNVGYTVSYLERRRYVQPSAATVTVPVVGLYSGRKNSVDLELLFDDGSRQALHFDIEAAAYQDPTGIYATPKIIKGRTADTELGFDYLAVKSNLGSPIVIDSDGDIRWVMGGVASGVSSALHDNGFIIGSQDSAQFSRLELDGTIVSHVLGTGIAVAYTNFHHNIDPGKHGLLAEVDGISNGIAAIESTLVELDPSTGEILKEWDLAALIADYMRSQGDDPTLFVRPGIDWFHMNAATYDQRDDSVVVSSRENFVVKLDYESGSIKWILGDPTKYWSSFPSLGAKALTLEPGGLYPIGQHATSITSDGLLLLFNDGLQSRNQPVGAPTGDSREYSAVSAYAIEPGARRAREVKVFDYGKTILSNICSSVYEASGGSMLVSYAVADQWTKARLVGLDAAQNVVFDFEYPTMVCNTSWNAVPLPFDRLEFR